MRRFQTGDEEAFRVLFDRYANHLVNFIYRFLRSQEESEDVAQEALLRIYRSKDHYDPVRSFRPWLFSIVSRLCSNYLRDRRRHPQISLDQSVSHGSDDPRPLQIADSALPLPQDALEKHDIAMAAMRALNDLPENQRTAVILRRFEALSYEEIAQAMGISMAAVKSLLFRARQTLKETLAPTQL
ncbi:MAG: sigma-70 family RNA polymerase sigma factor [Elusimicrobia bacterium]|nr:sigma-70 family RNA polymerase sigma factor [Elusimicrobiota bacterium]